MNKIAVNTFTHSFSKLMINLLEQISQGSSKCKVLLWTLTNCYVKKVILMYVPTHRAQACPFYRAWLTVSTESHFCLHQRHSVVVRVDVSLFSESERFSTHYRPLRSLPGELSVPAVWQLHFLPNFCSSPEDHKTLNNFIPIHWVFSDAWLLLKKWMVPKMSFQFGFWQRKATCSVECCLDCFPKSLLKSS